MTRDTVWQDDPPFAVGEHDTVGWLDARREQIAPATDAEIEQIVRLLSLRSNHIGAGQAYSLIARIKAEREQTIRELRDNYKCGEEYEAGLWSRRNIEAFFRDQEGSNQA